MRPRILVTQCLLLVGVACAAGSALGDDLARRATWSVPAARDVKVELDAWLASKTLDEAQKAQIAALWPDDQMEIPAAELLDQTVATLAVVEPAAKELANICRNTSVTSELPDVKYLSDNSLPPVVRNNLRLLYGAWLAQHDLHEEALEQFEGLSPNDVVDPAALLFYQSTSYHRLRDKDHCLPTVATLLENEKSVPRRFRELAVLMQADLEPLKPDTLDEVARLMDSIRRRLDLGRVGTRVRQEEDDVIAKLDKMIDDLEEQRKQQEQQAASGSQGGTKPASPLPDSQAAGTKGPGNVDPKKLENNGTWGNLPPKGRQEALQQISKELPAHYREAIEEYFRKIARDGDK